ncbi:glycosyltransferase family A protein [Nostoc sp. CMAA1605]|uniref:glycosyltransferase family A protein n=1 Tax=Nostoc sp. CMAA1605 TaxID=2055159 RepID=UPI001F3DC7FC|nr:glycosyltransferase family A protein [Nostoc sp. CMAA1605]MCF4970644.1 hypothetical protein [Nostoc sp. CMAA1605]
MLVFIIPLKSAEVSKSWDQVSKLFERSLRSICNQTDSDFRVVVVCHERPKTEFSHPHVHYLEVDFPLPNCNRNDKNIDKCKKIIKGLMYAKALFVPNHIMIADADDCVSRNLVSFVNQHPDSNGWVVNKGYVYKESSAVIYYRKSHFYAWCGTCNIINMNLCPLPEKYDDYPDDLVEFYRSHGRLKETLKNQGHILENLPMIGSVYIIGNGENIYQKGFSTIHNANQGKILFFFKELLKFRPLTSSIRKEFNLYQLE